MTEDERRLTNMVAADNAVKKVVSLYIKSHVDPYPIVLEMLNEVLKAGIESNNIGGSEPEALKAIGIVIRDFLKVHDPHSAHTITV